MAEGLTKKQLKELRRLEKHQSQQVEQKSNTTKWIAISVVSALFLALFIGTIFVAKNKEDKQAEIQAQFATPRNVRTASTTKTEATNSAMAANAITITEYADLQCPACQYHHPIVKELLAAYPDKVKLAFKHYPLSAAHPNAMDAAIAAEAAGRQGKFFQMVDMMYERQNAWAGLPDPKAKFVEYAKELGLDIDKFNADLKDKELESLVNKDREEGINNGVNATPTFFIGNERINIPNGLDEFKKLVDERLSSKNSSAQPSVTVAPSAAAENNSLQLQQ